MGSRRVGTRLTGRVRRWLEAEERSVVLRRCGGDQNCPWCCQWVNHFEGTHVRTFTPEPMLDEITCGNCGGTSIWKWEVGFIYVTAGDRPPSADRPSGFGDSPFTRTTVENVRRAITEREAHRAALTSDKDT